MFSKKILINLEYDKILNNISKYLLFPMSSDRLFNSTPAESFEDAIRLQNLSAEADRIMYFYNRSPLENFDDVIDVLNRASKLSILSFSDLIRISHLLRSSRIFVDVIRDISDDEIPLIKLISKRLYQNKLLEDDISDTFLSDEEISDNATPELASLRKNIRKKNLDIKDKLASIIRSKDVNKYLQDTIVTSRDGRYVIPVKTDFKGKVDGLVHDFSATGSTVYIEPIEVVEINNDLRLLYIEEQNEIDRILQEFTKRVSLISDALFEDEDCLVNVDIIFAKVKYGKAISGIIPKLINDGTFNIINGRHPLLKCEKVIPVSIVLQKSKNYILISGPNTGGKTVTLKMVGLFALLAISGMYVSASDGTEISFYTSVFSDIGDEQSIENNLSTFSSHIKTLKEIVDNVDDKSLVLLDEIGGGTDPQEGSALALAVLEYLLSKNSVGIITTHYSELKEFSYTTDKMVNASMEFDMKTLSPTYKLNIGVPGNSKALEIAGRLGMDSAIIKSARCKISPLKNSFDEIISAAEQERIDAKQIKDQYLSLYRDIKIQSDALKNEQEKLLREKENATKLAKIEAKRIVADATMEAEEILKDIKRIYKKESYIDGADVIEASKLKNKIASITDKNNLNESTEDFLPFEFSSAKVGDKVYVKSLGAICQICEIKRGEISIIFGTLRLKAKNDDLMCVNDMYIKLHEDSANVNNKLIPAKRQGSVKIKNSVKSEINIVGLRVYDAQKEVENYLDDAIMSSLSEIKIIHGVGTMALKKMVQEVLKNNKHVKSYRSGQFGEGELGVTIAELKK